jgi:glycosyltransferase involved in cell wall biosynthesis
MAIDQVSVRAEAASDTRIPDLTVIVPVRNAEDILEECLSSIVRAGPREVIVVDGLSTDRSVAIARSHGATLLSDDGQGLPAARLLGAERAGTRYVALVDADVVLRPDDLQQLMEEFVAGGYTALQAGLLSTGGPGYWGRALAHHHRTGLSRNWFGLVATIFERDILLTHGFDASFLSGEDIEMRWRLERAGRRIGVSTRTVVTHRFAGDSFAFARSQFHADGKGLQRMVQKNGWRAGHLVLMPFAGAVRGIALSLGRREPKWIAYYVCYCIYNYLGMLKRG